MTLVRDLSPPPALPGIARLDALDADAARAMLLACCGSPEWARRMAGERPFTTLDALLEASDRIWRALPEPEWLRAFAAHPRIGDRAAAGREAEEQAGALLAGEKTADAMTRANREYEERFGRIFLVCASGKSAGELLALCRARLHNDPKMELGVAAEEQRKITRLRLERLAREP